MSTTLTIGTATAASGERAKGIIDATQLASGDRVSIPMLIINGTRPGPCLWVTAAIHGNEFNGVISSLRFFDEVDPNQLSGSVILTPISNPLAFYARQRFSPQDGGNQGECYPGKPDGSITQQIAYAHFNEIRKHADYVIDLHASGVTNSSNSYSVIKYSGHPETEQRALALLLANGIHLNCSVDTLGENDEPVPLTGSLDLECMQMGIPSFMLELGHANRVEESVVQMGLAGLMNSLRHLKMIDGDEVKHPGQVVTSQRFIVRCSESGLVVQARMPHDFVQSGDIICRVYSPLGDLLEEVKADRDMHLISLKEDCVVSSGDRVAFAGA